MKFSFSLFFLILIHFSYSQDLDKVYKKPNLAKSQIKELKEEGALVLRLILHKKNADLYRKAGKHKVADRIEKDLRNRNQVLAKVLLDESFEFCKVYIIEAKNTGRVLNGETSSYFLNENLIVDSSIVLNTDKVYFMEIGNIYESLKEVVHGEPRVVYSSNPVLQDVLVIKDKNLQQLLEPFPYYVKMQGLNLELTEVKNSSQKKDTYLKFPNLNGYRAYAKARFGFKKSNLYLASNTFYLHYKLSNFYYSSLTRQEKNKL